MNKVTRVQRRTLPDDLPTLHRIPLLHRLFAQRGVRSPQELELSLERLIPVSQLQGIAQAVEVLLRHHAAHSRMLVIGDFDADGATSTALVVRQLRALGFSDVDFLVPNRFQFGYGLTPEIVMLAFERRPQLIITVDNGISSIAGVAAANALGIEVLVTDHHLPGAQLPRAAAIVNPNAAGTDGNDFPSKALAGVGVAFYLMAALTREMQQRGLIAATQAPVAQWLDLVALGTVADVVPLDTNNRILVAQGLKRIRGGRCVPGIQALLEVANKRIERCVATDLGFQLGPRLNAAGRLDDMRLGIECLLTNDMAQARSMAAQLHQLNYERRELEQQMQGEALISVEHMQLDAPQLPLGLCLYEEHWHQGVVGLVASRIKDRVHRPVIAMARADDTTLKGSARSVPGVHIRDVLDAVAAHHPGLIDKFGGHAMAAGLSIHIDKLAMFQQAFDEEVSRWMTHEDAVGVLHSDGELSEGELTLDVAQQLRDAGPWGQHFPEPMFDGKFVVQDVRIVGERHLKLKLQLPTRAASSATTEAIEAIAFRYFDDDAVATPNKGDHLSVAYRLDINDYRGEERVQLLLEHVAHS